MARRHKSKGPSNILKIFNYGPIFFKKNFILIPPKFLKILKYILKFLKILILISSFIFLKILIYASKKFEFLVDPLNTRNQDPPLYYYKSSPKFVSLKNFEDECIQIVPKIRDHIRPQSFGDDNRLQIYIKKNTKTLLGRLSSLNLLYLGTLTSLNMPKVYNYIIL